MRKLYPVSVSCGVLEVSASGYFNWLRRRESGHAGPARRHSDEALLAHIRAIHAEVKGEYGWPRMHKELLARGIRVGKDRVRKLMQQHGIRAKTKRKFVVTTDSRHSLPVAPDLVQRRFTTPRRPTSSGVATSPTSRPTRAGCTWLRSSTCSTVRWWVGACSRTCRPAWSRTRWPWRGGAVDRLLG